MAGFSQQQIQSAESREPNNKIMRFFTSQRPGFGILFVSCFFLFFSCVFFPVFFLFCFLSFSCFVLLFFLFFFTVCGCCFLFHLLFSSGCHALSDVLPHFSNPGFSILRLNMSAKHSCKNTEYETFDFGSSGPNRTPTQKGKMNTKEIGRKQDPNAEGKNDLEKNTKE